MIIIHNYNDLIKQRDEMLQRKHAYYAKYHSNEDSEVTEMITIEDVPNWLMLCTDLERVNRLIEGWEIGNLG